jgi:hypothetical protein
VRRRRGPRLLRVPPVEILLPLACLASALVLAASELMVTFDIVNPAGDAIDELDAADRHGYVMFVIAFFALFALGLAVLEGSKPAAVAVAVAGGLALFLFLIIDLPDAGQVGTVDEPVFFANAETEPRAGFWFELIGALCLAVSGAALATLTPEQLGLRDRWLAARERRKRGAEPERAVPAEEEPTLASTRHRPAEGGDRAPPAARERVSDRVARVRRASSRRRQD